MSVLTKKHLSRRDDPEVAWASPSHCRCSTRWRRPRTVFAQTRQPRRQEAPDSSPWKWSTGARAARRSARRRTYGRRNRPAATSICRRPALELARAVPRRRHDRQQHRPAQRRGVHAAGNRRRPLPLERGVPDPVASEADRGQRRLRRARRSISSTRRSSARTRRFRRCSSRSRTSTRPAAAPTATRASTPTRSAGRRRRSRCR